MRPPLSIFLAALNIAPKPPSRSRSRPHPPLGIVVIAWLHNPPWDYKYRPGNQPLKIHVELRNSGHHIVGGQTEAQTQKGRAEEPSSVSSRSGDWSVSDKIAALAGGVALLQFIVLIATW